jgi:dTDP-4-dehydrorhamnose 3,5-epimerase
MRIEIVARHLDEIVVLRPGVFEDDRGFFMESWRADRFAELGLPTEFVQDNHSRSRKGVVRGLHFQYEPPMGKLMRVTSGTAFLVAVDVRRGSPTLGRWVGLEVSAENRLQVWAPPWFARGMCALTDVVDVHYKCTGVYGAAGEVSIRWDDPAIGIEWPVENPRLSERDRRAPTLGEWLERPESERLRYDGAWSAGRVSLDRREGEPRARGGSSAARRRR